MMQLIMSVFVLFFVNISVASAATFYVRTDGGTTTQCTGQTDAAYSTSVVNKACAFSHPFWALAPTGGTSKMIGGDTLIIGPGQYMMGFGAPNTSICSSTYTWACNMRSIPSGTATLPTRILGKGWDTGCTAKPQLWGTERSDMILDLTGSNYVQVQCLDVTDHSSCMLYGPDSATKCNRDTYPYGPWAMTGLKASDSKNVLLKNLKIHGLRNGVWAARLQDWTVQDSAIIANSFVGWDGDMGATTSSNSGTITFKNTKIQYSGCGETYPGLAPHHCYSQDQGGYGDDLGTNATGGNWVFDGVDISHNVSDGLDLLYHTGVGSITIRRSRFEGNAGNAVKVAAKTIIDNSIIIGNCGYFKGKSFASTTDTLFKLVAFNNCRAGGSAVAMNYRPGMTVGIYNSTITGAGDTIVMSAGTGCLSTDKIVSRNNIYVGSIEFNDGVDRAALYYASGQYGNAEGACGTLKMDSAYDIIWGTKNNSTNCKVATQKCVDPKVATAITNTVDVNNVALLSGSPAINAGTTITGVAGVDYNNFTRTGVWDIGALEYGSVAGSACVSTGVCNAATPACGTTTFGTDNCGASCSKTGSSCSSGPVTYTINYTSFNQDAMWYYLGEVKKGNRVFITSLDEIFEIILAP